MLFREKTSKEDSRGKRKQRKKIVRDFSDSEASSSSSDEESDKEAD